MAERRLDADQLPTMKQIWSPGQGLRGLGTESLSAGRRPHRLPTNPARSHRASSPSERCHTAPSHTWPSPHTVLCRRASTCKKTTEGPHFPREKSTFYPCNQRQQREMGSKKMKKIKAHHPASAVSSERRHPESQQHLRQGQAAPAKTQFHCG